MEKIIGYFKAIKINWMKGNVLYLLIFKENALLGARIGGQFSDLNAKTSIGLVLGGAAGAMAAGEAAKKAEKKQSGQIKKICEMPEQDILKMHKDNFRMPYPEIDKIELNKSRAGINGARCGVIKISGRQSNKIDIPVEENFDKARDVVKTALPNKSN